MKPYLFLFAILLSVSSLYSKELSVKKCGTFSPNKREILNRVFNQDLKDGETLQEREVPELDKEYTSPKGRFLIHYTLTGDNAVDKVDVDKNSVPDYVDSTAYFLDQAWDYQVDKLGMVKPKSDDNKGGNGLYDVYLLDLGCNKYLGFYGVTIPDGSQYPTSSYILIDNNFSKDDGYYDAGVFVVPFNTFGYDALKVTCAHEFNHAIQFSYEQYTDKTDVLAEMTSVAFEYIMHPEVKDYVFNMNIFQKYPNKMSLFSSEASDGYYWAVLFIKMLENGYTPEFIPTFWKNTEKYDYLYDNLNATIKAYKPDSDIDKEVIELADYLYHTKSKASLGKHFADAKDLDSLKFITARFYSAPSIMGSGKLVPYAYFPMRIFMKNEKTKINDTLSIILINLSKEMLTSNYMQSNPFSYKMTELNSNSECDTTINNKYCFKLESKNSFIAKYYCDAISNSSADFLTLRDNAFPNPYTRESSFIAFPLDEKVENDVAHLSIYSIEGACIYEASLSISLINNTRAAVWQNVPEDINNGIYIYKVTSGENTIIGKFAVEKND